jgi:hypothetical protein
LNCEPHAKLPSFRQNRNPKDGQWSLTLNPFCFCKQLIYLGLALDSIGKFLDAVGYLPRPETEISEIRKGYAITSCYNSPCQSSFRVPIFSLQLFPKNRIGIKTLMA